MSIGLTETKQQDYPRKPRVSFVVPCYKLAHLLPDCVTSILGQTFEDFEIIIMDDCSPDNTSEVAQSFRDDRVSYIRNDSNLGGIRNYNKGIALARGEFIWLISADDYLRRPYILGRYIRLFDANPEVGYVICPGVQVRHGKEMSAEGDSAGAHLRLYADQHGYCVDSSSHGSCDAIFKGREFIGKLITAGKVIIAASGCVRRTCYEKVGLFPVDMIWGGDTYLWVMFALYCDVGYLAEPMVCYRQHDDSSTRELMKDAVEYITSVDLALPWLFKRKADELGDARLVRQFLNSAAFQYARRLAARKDSRYPIPMTLNEFEGSLLQSATTKADAAYVRSQIDAFIGNEYYWRGEAAHAQQFYASALRKRFWMPKIWMRLLLLSSGAAGTAVRRGKARLTRLVAGG